MKNKFAFAFILTLALLLLSALPPAVSHAQYFVGAEITSFSCDGFDVGINLAPEIAPVDIDFQFQLYRTNPSGPYVSVTGSITQNQDLQFTSFSWGDFLPGINPPGDTYVLPDGTLAAGVYDIPTINVPNSGTAGTVCLAGSSDCFPLHFSMEPITCEGEGGEGCTPGYWKNHLEDWLPTGYSPYDDFDTTFGVDLFNPEITLGKAIRLGGGGVKKVARHGTAALLSAAHPDVNYPYNVDQVFTFVQGLDVEPLVDANELDCEIP